jgi:pimeloyl-ACP methyl ester carboxylesterase
LADPLADFVRLTRAALTASGLERRERDGLVWFEGGAGPTVVLLHGVNDQAGTWASVARALVANHHLIVPDLAGHGESEPAEGPIPISLIVESLGKAVGDNKDVTLIGNSMGAWIAILYTLAHPERVARLVLESGGGLAMPLAVPLVATNRDDAMMILRAVHGPNAVLPEWSIDALLARATGSPMLRLTELEEHFVDSRLGELRVPTTIIWGKDDGVVPFEYVDAVRAGIAAAKLQVIEGAAHIPHAQQPERFLACLPAIS